MGLVLVIVFVFVFVFGLGLGLGVGRGRGTGRPLVAAMKCSAVCLLLLLAFRLAPFWLGLGLG